MDARDDVYREIISPSRFDLKIKGSRFLAEAYPAGSAEEALDVVDEIRRREHSATHHCWAYRVGENEIEERANDDGEPAGTAGQPILRQIEAADLVNVVVVVTRYFGGTKLGTGGLIRAYGDAARGVLDAARIKERVRRIGYQIRFSYDDTSAAMQTLSRFDALVSDSIYADDTQLEVDIRRSEAAAFESAFQENLSGRGEITRIG